MRDIGWKRLYQHIGYVNVIISYVKEFEKDPGRDTSSSNGGGSISERMVLLYVSKFIC